MHDKIIKDFVTEHFNKEVTSIKRLNGGMSNYVYQIEFDNTKYIFRVPGVSSDVFSDRKLEYEIVTTLAQQGIIEAPLFFDKDTGYKITKSIEGIPLNNVATEDKDFKAIAACLKELHHAPLFSKTYDYMDDLTKLENLIKDCNPEYDKIRSEWYLEAEHYLVDYEIKACHCDSQPNNFILSSDGSIHLIDWELAMNNDPLFDIACFGEGNFKEAILLFENYYDKPTSEQRKKLYLWRVFQCLKWYNGAMYKEEHGLSELLLVDFKGFSKVLLDEAINIFSQYKKIL